MARGFSQIYGIDYLDTYAPVVKLASIRILLAIAAIFGLEIHQMDVVTAFLAGELEEEIYMEQPEGRVERMRKNQTLQKFECYAWEITRMRSGSDAGTSSPVSLSSACNVTVCSARQ